jgi:hypothetical protein
VKAARPLEMKAARSRARGVAAVRYLMLRDNAKEQDAAFITPEAAALRSPLARHVRRRREASRRPLTFAGQVPTATPEPSTILNIMYPAISALQRMATGKALTYQADKDRLR